MSRKLTRRSFATLAVGIPGLAVLSACTPGEPAPPSPTANVAFTQRQTGGGAAESAAPEETAALPTVQVAAHDLYFDPPSFSIPPDTDVQVTLNNQGALQHNWVVIDQSLETALLNGGDSGSVTVNLPAGTYNLECSVPSHAQAGMVGVLTVDPSAPLPATGGGGAATGGTSAAGTPESGTPVATGGTPAAPAAAAPASVSISMIELVFEPADVTIPANTDVSVTVTNNGAIEHNWDVLGTAFKSEIAGSGDVQTITVNLAAGSYDIQCDVPGHAQAGMIGVLTVQ